MPSCRKHRSRIFVLGCFFAFAVKLTLSFTTYGTNDVLTWEADLRKIQSEGGLALYRDGAAPSWQGKTYSVEPFNHPPFMIYLIRTWGKASAVSSVPLRVWLRASGAVADLAMFLLVCGILKAERLPVRRSALLLLALSPVSILVSGFHGNTDPIMVCFLMLSIYFLDTGRSVWLAGAALGMAMNIKVVPIVFVPAILFAIGSWRSRIGFALSAGLVWLAASFPYLVQDPALVIRGVFGYNPVSGSWGLPEIAYLLPGETLDRYRLIGRPLALSVVLLASFWLHFRARSATLFASCGLIAFLFVFVISGFGPQYLSWIVPWWVVLPWRKVGWFYIAASLYLIVLYTAWTRGGWYLANMMDHSPLPTGTLLVFLLEAACWISVGTVVLAFVTEFQRGTVPPGPPTHIGQSGVDANS